jgi:NAD(P)-dependent dehydrogenase (short-subunit alcohol dehydrogenase family)
VGLRNNAGIFPGGTTAATDAATFDEVYAVNVKAPHFLAAAIAPAMIHHRGHCRHDHARKQFVVSVLLVRSR